MNFEEQDFESYTNDCLEDLTALQNDFMTLYDIESYENWFYDQDTGVFQFKSEDGRILYFKYLSVGSFSTKANTWKWSWDNKSVSPHLSRSIEKVKLLGQTRNFEDLTKGLFEGDEYTGWAMTAISGKILNAMGAYRVEMEHLFVYFIFINELTQEQYDSLKEKVIACDAHKSGLVAFICQHLNRSTYTGFHEAFDPDTITDEDDGYQAWCDECEKVRLAEGGWNDTSMAFAKIKLVCDQCFFEIRDLNKK